jgi:hypothetical protein
MTTMTPLKARVKNGRLVLDEPTDLPEGDEVPLVPLDALGEVLAPAESADERARAWSAEIERRAAPVRAGEARGRPAGEVFDRIEAKLRAR